MKLSEQLIYLINVIIMIVGRMIFMIGGKYKLHESKISEANLDEWHEGGSLNCDSGI